jgi:transcriptional regulator with XRE-family HTH domain
MAKPLPNEPDEPVESLHQFVLRELRSRGDLTIREVAEGAGISHRTVQKILSGEIADPGVSHCEKLATYFRARGKRSNKSAVRA